MSEKILVTGGIGFIGSHVVTTLIQKGYRVGIIDDLRNSKLETLNRLIELTGSDIKFYKIDIFEKQDVIDAFNDFQPNGVIHLAAEKSPFESIANPVKYYRNNIIGLCNILDAMSLIDCAKLVFSSSATVYGIPDSLPIDESMSTNPTNAYGRSKLFGESLIKDWCSCSTSRSAASLRYFNPVGAHQSGVIGENPEKAENIFPKIFQAIDNNEPLKIYGNDYNTRDGTGERDFIHIMDLADAHVSVIDGLSRINGYDFFNVGTGMGSTVLELVDMMSTISKIYIATEIVSRRKGDVGSAFADVTKIKKVYGWSYSYGLESMCKDSWKWFNYLKNS
jgi:UDP-glucose 4-epimerase